MAAEEQTQEPSGAARAPAPRAEAGDRGSTIGRSIPGARARAHRGRHRPAAIVECGSGVSTILIARFLRDRGTGPCTPSSTIPTGRDGSGSAAAEGLDGHARVIQAPLRSDRLAQPGCKWISGALDELPQAGVDLLLVDGPPASPALGSSAHDTRLCRGSPSRLAPGAK